MDRRPGRVAGGTHGSRYSESGVGSIDAVTSLHKETERRDRMSGRRSEAKLGLPCERLFLDLV